MLWGAKLAKTAPPSCEWKFFHCASSSKEQNMLRDNSTCEMKLYKLSLTILNVVGYHCLKVAETAWKIILQVYLIMLMIGVVTKSSAGTSG